MICSNKKKQDRTKKPNIISDFYSIIGDLILVNIDKDIREFKGLSQEEVIWYTQDLNRKRFNGNNTNNISRINYKWNKQKEIFNKERGFESNSNTYFEKTLLQVLVNIELVLANILRNEELKNG